MFDNGGGYPAGLIADAKAADQNAVSFAKNQLAYLRKITIAALCPRFPLCLGNVEGRPCILLNATMCKNQTEGELQVFSDFANMSGKYTAIGAGLKKYMGNKAGTRQQFRAYLYPSYVNWTQIVHSVGGLQCSCPECTSQVALAQEPNVADDNAGHGNGDGAAANDDGDGEMIEGEAAAVPSNGVHPHAHFLAAQAMVAHAYAQGYAAAQAAAQAQHQHGG